MAQRIAECGQPDGVARRCQQPVRRFGRAAAGQPVAGNRCRRSVEPRQALGGLSMHLQLLVRR
ncbi:MAG: hypothetical protein ABI409_17475, partial [Ramlibacter sp.]